jgi:hypothetical protein
VFKTPDLDVVKVLLNQIRDAFRSVVKRKVQLVCFRNLSFL